MTWPIPTLPTTFTNSTQQLDAHPQAHNALADAINEIAARGGFVASGTYTPTLTGMAIGTGGSAQNSASYTFVGGPNVGDKGLLSVVGSITFGTAGATFPTSPSVSLPSGFAVDVGAGIAIPRAATCAFTCAGTLGVIGVVLTQSTTTISFQSLGNTPLRGVTLSPTSPATWVAGDRILWHVIYPVVRV